MTTAHPKQWKEYQELDGPKAREDYFNSVPHAFVNTLDAHVEPCTKLRLLINGPIVDTILGKLLFHPNDAVGIMCEQALSLFKNLDPDEAVEQDKYGVVLKTCHRFNLCIRFVSCGASFCMASRLMDCMLPESAISYYGGCTEAVASNYTRIVCAYSCKSLQIFHQNSGAFRLHWIPRLIKGCHAWI